jgi:hypothetical protein
LTAGALVVLAAGLLAGSSLAYVCHPSAAGTRMVTLRGSVVSLRTHGPSVAFVLKNAQGTCSRTVWSTATGAAVSAPAICPAPARLSSGLSPLAAGPMGQRVVVARGALDRPDVLKVYAGTTIVRSLPLPLRPSTLVSSHGIAVVSARGQGVFAVRLSDGLFGFLGPDGGAFAPRLDARGVLFHDAESKLALRRGNTVVEHMTLAAVAKTIARTGMPLVTGGPIRSLSMDGPRVALAVGDTGGRCDRVLYWNVAWNPAQRVSAPSGPTCLVRPQGVQIPAVAIGGFRAEWLVTQNGASRLIAGSPLCQEWVLGRFGTTGAVSSLTGDGGTLAFAASVGDRTTVSIVNAKYRPVTIASGTGEPVLAADGSRVAILWPSGRIEVRSHTGALVASFAGRPGTALALQRNELVTLGSGRVSVYDLHSSRLAHSWPVAATAKGLDLENGIAAFSAGGKATVLDTKTGRTAIVGRAPTALTGVQIEGPGLAYAWTSGSKGTARFITTRQVDLALGLAP